MTTHSAGRKANEDGEPKLQSLTSSEEQSWPCVIHTHAVMAALALSWKQISAKISSLLLQFLFSVSSASFWHLVLLTQRPAESQTGGGGRARLRRSAAPGPLRVGADFG